MSIWSRTQEALWTGRVVKDYGSVADDTVIGAHRTISAFLAGKRARRFFLRILYRRWLGASVEFVELDRTALVKLDAAIHDALDRLDGPTA